MLRDDPDEAVVRLPADEEAVQVSVDEYHHHIELGKYTVDLCDALCNGLRKRTSVLRLGQAAICATHAHLRYTDFKLRHAEAPRILECILGLRTFLSSAEKTPLTE